METRDLFYHIFEASPVPTVILQGNYPDIRVLQANAGYIALTGRPSHEIINTSFFIKEPHPGMHLEAQGLSDVEQSIKEVYLKKQAVKTPVQKFLKPLAAISGVETLYFEATNTPILNTEGQIDFVIRTLQNVTDIVIAREKEKQKDAKLIDNERFLRETQKVARIGSWEMDSNNRFYWPDIHYEIMEVEPGTEITRDFGLTLLKGQRDRDIFEDLYKRAVEKGDYFDVELNVLTPKGNERWIRFTGKGELVDGVFKRMYGIGHDITKQKLTQQALEDSRNRLETLIQTVDGIVFESDAQTLELIFINGHVTDLLGYTPAECIRRPGFIDKLLYPDDKADILSQAFKQIHERENYTGDYRVVKKDGTEVWMKVSVSVIRENGAPKWLRGLMMDITASKRISELEHIEKQVLELNARATEPTTTVLRTYLQGIESIFPEMICSIMQVKNGHLYNWVANSLPPDYQAAIENLEVADNTGSCGTAAFKNEKVIASDIANDARWVNYKQIALQNNLRACWSQPIVNAGGTVIATLGMYYKSVKWPTNDELKIIDRAVYLIQLILQNRSDLELLEEANFLMRQSQELAHFGSVQLDVKTRELTWSNELYNIFGIDKTVKPTIDLYYDFLHPEDKDMVMARIGNFFKTHEDFVSEERIIRPDGEVRNLRTWGRIKLDHHGEPSKVIAAYMDITQSKRIQEELAASETRLRNLVESQTNYVIRIDFNGNYSYANKKYKEDFGFANGTDVVGTNAMAFVQPHQQQRIVEVSQKCIAHPNQVFEAELEKYGKDGAIKYTFWHFICLTNSAGQPAEIQCIGIDVSDRKKAENERERKTLELEQSESRYSDLFHLSPQPMWVYDVETLQFLDVNIAAIQQYGYTRDEFLSMTIKDIRPADKLGELYEANEKGRLQKDFFVGVFTHKKKSGERIQVEIKRNTIPFKGKSAHLVLANNITERLIYLEALEKQNKRLGEIAWIQMHIVRAPLARVLGLIDILENHDNDPVDTAFLLKNIVSSIHELDNIITDIVRKAEQATLNLS
ncbi:hypothetical protein DJ568_05575 [Mucilaginibacter hurinus]|uniref:histidine kinase n=1 Tax=Mucilaginibacter hurinus TaxID=2201324 RepID=A0A367GSY9_9SPHI|nr:PAS domain S-box protein [Mucilaginibacter hurinus]RCH56205.1 hypothetical protein DJ568_05575 [Mucilaginibacter hurinus]